MGRKISTATKMEKGWGVIDLAHPEQYKPWIQTKELTSGRGRRHMFPDIYYPERMIHLMSDLEKSVYFMLRKNELVKELFEQVPLDLKDSLRICEELNIQAPREPYTNEHIIMTTDFVAYVDTGVEKYFHAFAVKPNSELQDKRVLEKLLVEKKYWESRGIKWAVITEKNIIRA